MVLARTGSLFLRQQASRTFLQTRPASSHVDAHQHHDSHHDESYHGQDLTFPKEDFSSHLWGKALFATLGVVAFYKFAPAPGEDNYFSRLLAHYTVPAEYWKTLNSKHLLLSTVEQSNMLVIADAKKPQVHRYRYPQSMEQFSPHLHAVGKHVDMTNVVVKGDKS